MLTRALLCASLLAAGCGEASPMSGLLDAALGRDGGGAFDLAAPPGSPCGDYPQTLPASQARARGCGPGTESFGLLKASPYKKVLIEVAATNGAQPSTAALDHLRGLFVDLCDKPGGVSVQLGDMNIPAPGHPLTLQDLWAIEDAHRHQFALGDTAVFFYLVVSDPSASDAGGTKVLGLAHRASSMAVFQGSIRSVSGGLAQPSADKVESAVVAHELGHVLGLVNIAASMVTPHEDATHPGHDANSKCIMYWANNTSAGLVGDLLTGGNVADFDAACRADLKAVRDAP